MLREYLIGEAMHALGIPTTRALAAVLTGEEIQREVALPGAVLTRVAASHIRVGTFQFFASRGEVEKVRPDRLHPAPSLSRRVGSENPALTLLAAAWRCRPS